ncbi:MAG: tetratricopeptide repeat protein [Candidatus Moraniibacteriota bacterium]
MPSEKPSFARFGGSMNFASAGQGAPRTVSPENGGSAPMHRSGQPAADTSFGSKASKTAKMLDAVVSVTLVALFFGLPLFFTGLTFQGIAFEKQIYFYFWLLIGVVAWASKGVITGEMRIRRTPLDIPILLFWLFYVLAAFFSVDRWHSFWGFFGDPSRGIISVTALVLAYYFLLSHFTPKRFSWMFWSFLCSGFLVTVWSFLVVMKLRFLPAAWEKFAPMSLIGTISTLGIFLGTLVPLFLTALFILWKDDSLKKVSRTILTTFVFIALALALYLLLALYPFISWIVVLVGLGFFIVYVLAQIVRPAEQWTWVPMVVFVLVLAFLMIGKNNLTRAQLPVEVTPNTNLSWQIAKDTLKEHFLVGVGPANYGYAFSMFRSQEYNLNTLYTLRFYQGTGLFFEMLPTVGAVGTVLFLVLWLSFISVGLYLLTYEKQRNKIRSLGLWSAAVMFFVASFVAAVNGPLLIIGTLLAALALGVVLWESGSEERYLQLSLKAAPKFALALAFIFMVVSAGVAFLFVFMGKVFVADVYAGKAISLSTAGPNRDSANLLLRAIGSYPQEGRYYTRLGQEYMALANIEAGKGEQDRSVDAITFYVREAIAAGEQGRRLMPNDVLATESLGLLYENAGLYANDALPKAEELYGRSLELEPHNPLYVLKLGQIKKLSGDAKPEGAERDGFYKEARDLFQRSIVEKADLAVAHYNLAVVLSRLKESDQAIASAEEALRIDRNNLNYQYNLGVLYQLRDGEGDMDRAEAAFKNILGTNEKLIDVRLSLGLLYEKEGKRDAAVAEYEKILDILPDDTEGNVKQTRDQIQKFIENVRSGAGNLSKQNAAAVPVEATPNVPEVPELLPQAPAAPNESPLSGGGQ